MSTVKSKKLQVGTDATSSNNFTIYQPATPDGTLRIGVGNADSPTEVGQFNANGYKPTSAAAFEAYMNVNQAISAATWTKVAFNATVFDTTSEFDTTNNRFQPSVAGYYQINTTLYISGNPRGIIRLYKNGAGFKYGPDVDTGTGQIRNIAASWLVYMNGTTDYVELYAWRTTVGNLLGANTQYSNFSGFLVQQA
jgi:hypothetical protein